MINVNHQLYFSLLVNFTSDIFKYEKRLSHSMPHSQATARRYPISIKYQLIDLLIKLL